MTQIKLPETFISRCESMQRNPKEVAQGLLNRFIANTTEEEVTTDIYLQNFIPKLVEALNNSLSSNHGPFRAKYYPPPEDNTLWFHLTSVMDWWARTYSKKLDSPRLKHELRDADYIIGPKAVKIKSKATWCYGFTQPVDTPIITLERNHDFLAWTKTSAPRD